MYKHVYYSTYKYNCEVRIMIFYSINLAIFIIYSLFTNTYYKNHKVYFWLVLVHLTLLLGLRSSVVGTDTSQYVGFYLEQNTGFNGNGTLVYSSLSNFINWISNGNYHVFLFVLSLATVFFILKSIEILDNDPDLMFWSVFIYLTFYFYFESFNIQRQMLAISMTMFSIALLSKKCYFESGLMIVLAIGIHSTAIFALIGFLIWMVRKNKITFVAVVLLAALSNLFLNKLLNNFSQIFDHYQMYTDAVLESGGGTLLLGAFLLLLVVITVIFIDISDEKIMSFALFMTTIGAILFIFGSKSQLIIRMANYFAIYAIIFIPQAIIKLTARFDQRIVKTVLEVVVIIVGLVIFYYKLSHNLGDIIPYSLNAL